MNASGPTGYPPITDYGVIGDMHTTALINKTGSLDFMCWPTFDSPSVFCRLLDKDKGGHFSIKPDQSIGATSKQRYLPYTNIIDTKWISEKGVVDAVDYFPVSNNQPPASQDERLLSGWCPCKKMQKQGEKPPGSHSGLVRKVTCSRGTVDMVVQLFPAFNYARDNHTASFRTVNPLKSAGLHTLVLESESQKLIVDIHLGSNGDEYGCPKVEFELEDKPGLKGKGLLAKITMSMEQSATFVIHSEETILPDGPSRSYIDGLGHETANFWTSWTRLCTYKGHYREQVVRSLLILKLLTYKPTGAIVAAPTFSLPEAVGGSRNWDYRYSWIRDTTFVLYVFLENGYTEEAAAYMDFIYCRIIPSIYRRAKTTGQEELMPVLITIRGECNIPEIELTHLEGYRGSRPVRIGNGATTHTQLDMTGGLLDSIYLYNKFAGPISYDRWVAIRGIVNHIITLRHTPDMSIWEVRGERQNFVFSKIMLWVTVDRALRLSDKRSNLPCPDRLDWIRIRDEIYEEVMDKGYNSEEGFFCMSYEKPNVMDASVLVAPLVLFIAPDDPRLLSTIQNILKPQEKGGLTSAKMVFRYDHKKVQDGMYVHTQDWFLLTC